jgi:hypothetical protein
MALQFDGMYSEIIIRFISLIVSLIKISLWYLKQALTE